MAFIAVSEEILLFQAYVHSGKAEEAKRRAERKSPPPRQRNVLSKVAHSLKPSSARSHWKKMKEETSRYDLRCVLF